MRTLDKLMPKESGVISSLSGEGDTQQRLLEMGVSDGAEVEVLRFAPLGDPMEIYVRGFHLTLRKSEAALVQLDEE
jgi:ferrous iron transport protein A